MFNSDKSIAGVTFSEAKAVESNSLNKDLFDATAMASRNTYVLQESSTVSELTSRIAQPSTAINTSVTSQGCGQDTLLLPTSILTKLVM